MVPGTHVLASTLAAFEAKLETGIVKPRPSVMPEDRDPVVATSKILTAALEDNAAVRTAAESIITIHLPDECFAFSLVQVAADNSYMEQ